MAQKDESEPGSQDDTSAAFALIGAGPMGLAMAKTLSEQGVAFRGFELHSDVGGLWDIDGPRSTMYESAHLISSKHMTEFVDFPMADTVAEYPSHKELKAYFRDFAKHFDLYRHYTFGAEVSQTEPIGADGEGWRVSWRDEAGKHSADFAGVIIANGTLSEPNMPEFKSTFAGKLMHSSAYRDPREFDGKLMHSSAYRDPREFDGKRVLIIGAGNSGCDIAIDAIHHGAACDISVRRGYHFVPKYIFGRPADTVGGALPLPMWLKRKVDGLILKWFVGSPEKYGFPKPKYKLYESHPVVNSLILFHAGHGDIKVRADIDHFDGHTVHFTDGASGDYDIVLAATGYNLHYPFISSDILNWRGDAPHLFLNCMHPERNDLFVMGMVEALGLGWQGRHEQAEMVARYLRGLRDESSAAQAIEQEKSGEFERLTGGMDYIDLPRMAYYVDKRTFRRQVTSRIRDLKRERA